MPLGSDIILALGEIFSRIPAEREAILATMRPRRSITLTADSVRDDAGKFRKPRFKEKA